MLTPMAFQALMVTMRLTSAATWSGPPEHAYTTALARLCAVLADLREELLPVPYPRPEP